MSSHTAQKQRDLHKQSIIACVWDFDKTLIPGYMQEPLFEEYGVNARQFWKEVNALPEWYRKQGVTVSSDTVYLNHILSYVKNGSMKGLNNRKLREMGRKIKFCPGIIDFLKTSKEQIRLDERYAQHDIKLEHYIISTGLAEMIRGSEIYPHVDGVFGCEFLENPLPPGYLTQPEFSLDGDREIGQIGVIVDNTIKTRYIFEINKGTNKNKDIDVNSTVREEDRRIPIGQMIYTADGPSDIPVFALLKKNGGKTFAVYHPERPDEFAQNDSLLQSGRIHAYGPADYRPTSSTHQWLWLHISYLCQKIIDRETAALRNQVGRPPTHLHPPKVVEETPKITAEQETLFHSTDTFQ